VPSLARDKGRAAKEEEHADCLEVRAALPSL